MKKPGSAPGFSRLLGITEPSTLTANLYEIEDCRGCGANCRVCATIETSRLRVRLREARHEVEAQQQRAQTQSRQLTELETHYKRLTEEKESLLAQLLAAQKTGSSKLAPVLLTISVDAFRSPGAQGTQTLLIPPGAAGARLRLNLSENAFPSYRVTLNTEDGSEAFGKNGLKPRADKAGDFVIVNLPASRLTNGDNVLSLSGISPKGEAESLGRTLIKVRRR